MHKLSEQDKELVTVQICKIDADILNHIAKHDNITLAHALSMQFSGWRMYNNILMKKVYGDK
jgi:hypothetical protein